MSEQPTRDEQIKKWAHDTVEAVVAIPACVIVLLLLFAIIHGPAPEPQVVVNQEYRAACPVRTITPAELTTRYWEDC